jgi:hypothetical protein
MIIGSHIDTIRIGAYQCRSGAPTQGHPSSADASIKDAEERSCGQLRFGVLQAAVSLAHHLTYDSDGPFSIFIWRNIR